VFYPKGKNLWRLLEGICQMKMGWYFTSDEIDSITCAKYLIEELTHK